MLILTRKVGEEIIIGDDITIKLLAVKGNQARYGIDAPRDISVHRSEIYNRIQEEEEKKNKWHLRGPAKHINLGAKFAEPEFAEVD